MLKDEEIHLSNVNHTTSVYFAYRESKSCDLSLLLCGVISDGDCCVMVTHAAMIRYFQQIIAISCL